MEQWARAQVARIPEGEEKEDAINETDRAIEFLEMVEKGPGRYEDELEGLKDMYTERAVVLGIDLNDQNDSTACVVRAGIADLSPERVVKDCEALLTTLGSRGVIAERMGLPTAGTKKIWCVKFRHGVEGLSLDDTYSMFKGRYCNACRDRVSRPDNWRWTATWQEDQEKKQAGLVRPGS